MIQQSSVDKGRVFDFKQDHKHLILTGDEAKYLGIDEAQPDDVVVR